MPCPSSGADTGGPGLNGKLERLAIAIAPDGELHTSPLTRGWGPGGLPELVGVAIACDNGDSGYTHHPRAVALGALANPGPVRYLFEQVIAPHPCSPQGRALLAVDAIGKKLAVFDPPALQPDLKTVGACIRQVDAGNRIVGVLLSGIRHGNDTRKPCHRNGMCASWKLASHWITCLKGARHARNCCQTTRPYFSRS